MKKVIAILLSTVLVLTILGCSKETNPEDPKNLPAKEEQSADATKAPTTAPTATPTEAPKLPAPEELMEFFTDEDAEVSVHMSVDLSSEGGENSMAFAMQMDIYLERAKNIQHSYGHSKINFLGMDMDEPVDSYDIVNLDGSKTTYDYNGEEDCWYYETVTPIEDPEESQTKVEDMFEDLELSEEGDNYVVSGKFKDDSDFLGLDDGSAGDLRGFKSYFKKSDKSFVKMELNAKYPASDGTTVNFFEVSIKALEKKIEVPAEVLANAIEKTATDYSSYDDSTYNTEGLNLTMFSTDEQVYIAAKEGWFFEENVGAEFMYGLYGYVGASPQDYTYSFSISESDAKPGDMQSVKDALFGVCWDDELKKDENIHNYTYDGMDIYVMQTYESEWSRDFAILQYVGHGNYIMTSVTCYDSTIEMGQIVTEFTIEGIAL